MTSTLSADDHRIIARGLAVQPFIAGVLGFLLFLPTDAAIVMGAFFAITGTAITGCVAYPMLLWFLRRRHVTLLLTLAGGAAMGNIPAVVAGIGMIAGNADGAADFGTLIRPMAAGTLVGVVSAGAFWGVSGRHLA